MSRRRPLAMHVRPTTSTAPSFRSSGETVTESGDAVVALFAELLGIPTGTQEAIAAMSPLQKKGLLFRTFLAQLEGLAARGAILIVLEDAHWLDPTSRELFDQIVDRV